MSRRPTAGLPATVLLLLVLAGAAGAAPSGNADYDQAVAHVEAMVADLDTYDLRGTLTMSGGIKGEAAGATATARLEAAARWPDRLLSVQDGQMVQLYLGTGPEQSWFYLGQIGNAYVSGPTTLVRDLAGAGALELTPERIFNFYAGLGPFLLEPDLDVLAETGQEDVTVGDRVIPCRVFTTSGASGASDDGAPAEGPRRILWDPASGLVLRSEMSVYFRRGPTEMQQDVVFALESFRLGEPVDDARFQFDVPAGVRVVDSLDRLTNPDAMTGQAAPDITFTELEGGRTYQLSELRGQPVFIDFWATWCPPCRQEMPHIETLYREFGKSGRMRFVAASNEDPDTIKRFLVQNPYSFPVVTVDGAISQERFRTNSIPVGFVIDADGVIRAHMVGAQSEAQLRAAFARVGVE